MFTHSSSQQDGNQVRSHVAWNKEIPDTVWKMFEAP